MRTHYGPWQPCWFSNQHQKHKSGRGSSNEHFWQVWLKSVQRFQRRRFKWEKLTDGRTTDAYPWQKLTWPMARWAKKELSHSTLSTQGTFHRGRRLHSVLKTSLADVEKVDTTLQAYITPLISWTFHISQLDVKQQPSVRCSITICTKIPLAGLWYKWTHNLANSFWTWWVCLYLFIKVYSTTTLSNIKVSKRPDLIEVKFQW